MQLADLQTELDFSEPPELTPAPTPISRKATNAYPTDEQLSAISEQPYTYDLRVPAFRKYWTSRTGYRFNAILDDEFASKSKQLTQALLEQNDAALASGGNYRCQWYQHIWNLFVAKSAALQVAA